MLSAKAKRALDGMTPEEMWKAIIYLWYFGVIDDAQLMEIVRGDE